MKAFVLTFLAWSLGAFSILAGALIALWALMLMLAVLPEDTKWMLRSSGLALGILCVLYLFPLRYIRSTKGLVFLAVSSVAAAFAYAGIYNQAELNDPFRSENEFGAAYPFETAAYMCILPIVRTSFAWLSKRLNVPNQSTDPTLASGTPPAGQESGLP